MEKNGQRHPTQPEKVRQRRFTHFMFIEGCSCVLMIKEQLSEKIMRAGESKLFVTMKESFI
jgi:hypothetical protein